MKNPKYLRLTDEDGKIIGIKRIVTEYLPENSERWQLEPIEYDDAVVLTTPPMGVELLPSEET